VVNQPPTMMDLADLLATVGNPITFTAVASDPDGDPVTFTLASAPAGATIDASGNFTWTPAGGQTGATAVTVKASDPGGAFTTRSCTITVS
jgi:Putative Ig domain